MNRDAIRRFYRSAAKCGGDVIALVKYEAAKAALAEARRVDEIKDIRDTAEAMRLCARMAKDVQLELDAAELRVRAERKLGTFLARAKEIGQIGRGRRWEKSNSSKSEELERINLDQVGVDHKLSSRSQKLAAASDDDFENVIIPGVREKIAARNAVPINGARAIAASRQEPDDSLDYFPTPPFATRALIEHVLSRMRLHRERLPPLSAQSVWEPACGEGHMAEVLGEYFGDVCATDIHSYGYGDPLSMDFLSEDVGSRQAFDWIITNPPFGDKTEAFVLRALELARIGVAMFVRLQWLEGIGRYERIYRDSPPTQLAIFTERVPLCKGQWNPDGGTLTAYIWLVWLKGAVPRPPMWIPPGQRKLLTRADDRERFTIHPVIRRQVTDPPNEPARVAATHSGDESEPVVRQASGAGSPN